MREVDAAMRASGLSWLYCIAVALIFYHILRESGANAPYQLFLHNDIDAGAMKLAAFTLFAAMPQLFALWQSSRLGYFGLIGVALVLLDVLLFWGVLGYSLEESTILIPVVILVGLVGLIVSTKTKSAH